MLHNRPQSPLKSESGSIRTARGAKTYHRANPMGIGRLLIMVFTVALLSMGQGLWWWGGLVLLFLILLAVTRQGYAWGSAWASVAILLALAFWHQHIIANWIGILLLGAGIIQFSISMLRDPKNP